MPEIPWEVYPDGAGNRPVVSRIFRHAPASSITRHNRSHTCGNAIVASSPHESLPDRRAERDLGQADRPT